MCGNDQPTTFPMKDCEILASSGNTTIECARMPTHNVVATHKLLEEVCVVAMNNNMFY